MAASSSLGRPSLETALAFAALNDLFAQRRTIVASPAVGLALAAAERAKWLQYGQEWERRYRQMYPILEGG